MSLNMLPYFFLNFGHEILRALRMVFTSQIYSLNFVGMFITILIMCANIIKNIEDRMILEH